MTDRAAAPSGRRIAILHYTAQPAIGGIESFILRQCEVLAGLGHRSRCVVGGGSGPAGTETVRISAMDPGNGAVVQALEGSSDSPLSEHHPLVQALLTELEAALVGCTDCWVHNVLTVSLNPFLTVALALIIKRRPDLTWIAWTADLSAISRFVEPASGELPAAVRAIGASVTWIAISRTRRDELSAVLGIQAERITVVNPPLDVLTWLDVGGQSREVIGALNLLVSGPVVLVPAKALPHKCLERAVRVGAALSRLNRDARTLITAAPSPHDPAMSTQVVWELRRIIKACGAESAVILLSDLLGAAPSDRTVRELMQLSDVVFLPSIEEGFGLPLWEAAALGVPLVCTDIPVFREVTGDRATFFDHDQDDDEIARLVLAASQLRSTPVRHAALSSMIRFRDQVRNLLAGTAHPNV